MKPRLIIALVTLVLGFFAGAAGIRPLQKAGPAKAAGSVTSAAASAAPVSAARVMSLRQRLLSQAAKDVGVREATGKNDGPRIEQMQKTAGCGKGDPYCAAAVFTWGKEALGPDNPFPRSAWSPDFCSRPTWLEGRGDLPRGGDTFGIYFASKGRVAHTGLVEKVEGGYAITIEANTGPDGSLGEADRNGDGIRRKRRLLAGLRCQSWLP